MIYIGSGLSYYFDTEKRAEMPLKSLQIFAACNYTILELKAADGHFSTK